jgi:mannose/fructose-specific phosphotransferase system component IIA
MNNPLTRGVVVTHGSLAAALCTAVRQIAGVEDDVLVPLSNEGRGPAELIAEVDARLGEGPVIVFTDLPSGSCAFAARKIALTRPATAVICGTNLPILLDFVFHRELPLPELLARLIEKGRSGINGTCMEEVHADRALSGR